MALGPQGDEQCELMLTWAEMPRSPGHVFYDRFQEVLVAADFDAFAEDLCAPYYGPRMGPPSIPPGRYFRMHLIGYFEGIDSEREIEWRCADSLSLREYPRLGERQRAPDHSLLSKARGRLPHEVQAEVLTGCWRSLPSTTWSRASGSALTPRPWRPMRRCARSCAGTAARATGICLGAWQPKAGSRRRWRTTWCAWTRRARARSCRTRTGFQGRIRRPRSRR